MKCAERNRLFNTYYDQVSDYFSSVIRDKDWSKVQEASVAAENARALLERHEVEHGCSHDRFEQ